SSATPGGRGAAATRRSRLRIVAHSLYAGMTTERRVMGRLVSHEARSIPSERFRVSSFLPFAPRGSIRNRIAAGAVGLFCCFLSLAPPPLPCPGAENEAHEVPTVCQEGQARTAAPAGPPPPSVPRPPA